MRTESESQVGAGDPGTESENRIRHLRFDLDNNKEYLARSMKLLRVMAEGSAPVDVRFVLDGVDYEPTYAEVAPSIRRRAMSLQHRISALEGQIATEEANLKELRND